MAIDYLNKNGLSYFWSKLKAHFAPKVHTHNAFETKHSYTVAANAAKNWYRIANASTQQLDTSKPIRAQFIVTAYNTSYAADYYETWFVNAIVFGRQAHIVIFGGSGVPFSQARILYENTVANIDANDRPAIDLYLNYVLPNGTTKIEVEEIYNNGGWTFVADGQLATSSVPSGFEAIASAPRGNGVNNSTNADYANYLNRQISNITAAFTLADSYLYRSRTLNCTGTFTITIPSINSGYMWCVIKNKNTSSGVITLHPSTTSVLIDGSNVDITLQPMEYVCIHSAGANNYSLIADGRWKTLKADKATTLAGYGITDAKIANGTITLGSNSITPLTSVPSHNQASNTITSMTGYSKPSSTSAITTSDTLNQAVGKLEKAIDDADISNVVHITGVETITGKKTFTGLLNNIYANDNIYGLLIRNPNLTRGIPPTQHNQYISIQMCDALGDEGSSGRLALIEYNRLLDGNYFTSIATVKNVSDAYEFVDIRIGYDSSGNYFARTVSTPVDNPVSTDIVTRDWIPKDTRIVHTSGDETISGEKTFTTSIKIKRNNPYINFVETDITNFTDGDSTPYQGLYFRDKNEDIYAALIGQTYADRSVINILVYDRNGDYSQFQFYRKPDGTEAFASFPTPDASAAGTQAATAAWVRTFCDITQKYMKAVSVTGSGNAVTTASLSNGTLTLTKGSTFLTSHQSLANYVTLNGAQTVTGAKIFTQSPTVQRANPYVVFVETDIKKGTGVDSGGTGYQGLYFRDKSEAIVGSIIGSVYGGGTNKNYYITLRAVDFRTADATAEAVVGCEYSASGVKSFRPEPTNDVLLGTGGRRWKEIWCNQSSINTSSDERIKDFISDIPDEVLDAWEDVRWRQFKYKDAIAEKGAAARLHSGAVAQEVDRAFHAHNLDVSGYGLFLHDSWEAVEETRTEDGAILSYASPAGDEYGLRYVEALCMEAAYMRRENARLKKRVANLEERLAALELKIA